MGSISGKNHDRTDAEQDAWILADKRKRMKYDEEQKTYGFQADQGNEITLLGSGSKAVQARKDGLERFNDNGEAYIWNPDLNRYEHYFNQNKYYSVNPIEEEKDEGGGGGAPRRAPTSGVTGDVGAVATPGVTTEEVLGTQGYNSMNNFVPTSHTMGNDGQTQHLNPLVAAENWVHQLQPQPTYNLGQYINPGIGLLEDEQQNSIWGTV